MKACDCIFAKLREGYLLFFSFFKNQNIVFCFPLHKGPDAELRLYLEELAEVDDVQQYIQDHPYGQHHINESNPS